MQQEQQWFSALGEPSIARLDVDGTLRLEHADGSSSRLVRPVAVHGTVTYLARIAMLLGSVVTVVLEDSARADAPATTIAEQRLTDPGNVPVAFVLTVDRAAVPEGARLGLRARIDVAGEMRWATHAHHPVDLDSEQPHELIVRPVGG